MSTYQQLDIALLVNLPANLTSGQRYLVWREDIREGKPTKVPVSAITGCDCDVTDLSKLTALDKAIEFYKANATRLSGIGRVFVIEDGIAGIDFDDARDASTGMPSTFAKDWLTRLNSYTEISPSGRGYKVWIKGDIPGSRRRHAKLDVEMYNSHRFFTITGRRLDHLSGDVEERQAVLNALYQEIFPAKANTSSTVSTNSLAVVPESNDDVLLQKAFAAKNGPKLRALFDGQYQELGYGSQSEADLGTCMMLAFWTRDAGQIDRLFRRSKLYRDKWDERRGALTYGEMTVANALERQTETYSVITQPAVSVTHPYVIGPRGNLMLIETTKDKDGHVQQEKIDVTDAGYLVVNEILAGEGFKVYEGKIISGSWSAPFELPAKLWANKIKFCEAIKEIGGERLLFSVGAWEHVARAAEVLNPGKRIRRMARFGWDDEFTRYFGADCVITADGIRLPGDEHFHAPHLNLSRLHLSIPDGNLQPTLQHLKDDLMCFNSTEAMAFLLGIVFVAPFRSYFAMHGSTTNAIPSIILQGTTGDGKTAMLTLAQCFYGHVRETGLSSLASTPRALNDIGHFYRDALYALDDLKWSALSSSVQEQLKGILQAYADGHARDRLVLTGGGDWEPAQGREILGTLAISGEDLPSGESSFFGRFMIVHVGKDRTLDVARYTRCLERSKDYSAVTADNERRCFVRLRRFLGDRIASGLTLADCDQYRDWRTKGGFQYEEKGKLTGKRVGNRVVDIELQALSCALNIAVRNGTLRTNPLQHRTRYHRDEDTRHCREVAPTEQQLRLIDQHLREKGLIACADCISFLAFSGLRVNEALALVWKNVDWINGVINVKRQKRGINPWVPILTEMEQLLKDMHSRSCSEYLFPSLYDAEKPLPYPTLAHCLRGVCKSTKMKYVTLHGMRSFFVTQCRESGLSDAEIAMLIGDKTGPSIIATTYGDVRPDHLLAQAKRVRLMTGAGLEGGR